MGSTVTQFDGALRRPMSRAVVAQSAQLSANVIQFPTVASSGPPQAMLALDVDGVIRDCSAGAEQMFNCRRDELVGSHISDLLPSLANTSLNEGAPIYPRLAYLNRSGAPFRAFRHNGEEFGCHLFLGNPGDVLLVILARRIVNGDTKRR